MANTTLDDILEELNMPTCIGSWQEDEIVPDEPYLEYHRQDADDVAGDDGIAAKRDIWELSLYGKQKDAFAFWGKMNDLEDVLDARRLSYSRSGDILFDDCMYCVYTMTLPR
ncbi:hypothetical protein [Adlercreutzia sp. ZJ138]|uniref:hypothetical protein n=1 Tax=Adlercreutzia sp. ZJ138 TaxID=2709405 RepID=UPI0013ED7DC2|nr:hypothetical protein [Adlercreutzia sp. ZJ138]